MAHVTQLKIELEEEEDGRWIGEVPALPGVMAYGQTRGQEKVSGVVSHHHSG